MRAGGTDFWTWMVAEIAVHIYSVSVVVYFERVVMHAGAVQIYDEGGGPLGKHTFTQMATAFCYIRPASADCG